MLACVKAGTEKRRSTKQRNTVTIRVAETPDSTFDWRKKGLRSEPTATTPILPLTITPDTTPDESEPNVSGQMEIGPEESKQGKLDPQPSPVTQIHRPARLATRAASSRYGGRHHSGIPGGIIPLSAR